MKSGFVAIVGRPSVGKSTLMNAMCGQKVAITASIPQTTRNAIRGILNTPEGQVVFLDTPGYHQSEKKLNIHLKDVVHRTLNDADAVLYVLDVTRRPGPEEQGIMELLDKSRLPVVTAVNKIDADAPMLTEIRGLILGHRNWTGPVEVSALEGTNVDALIAAVVEACPGGEPHYPSDFYTDQTPEFRMAEIIREQAIVRSEQELPHALYVEIADMEFGDPDGDDTKPQHRQTLWVRAFLVVERKSQLGILVGRNGTKIKAIRIDSLKEMRKIFPWAIRLDLRVKVNPKWRRKEPLLRRMVGPGE